MMPRAVPPLEGQPPSSSACNPTEAGSGLDLVVRDARDEEELAEDLAIAERALDEYRGILAHRLDHAVVERR